MLNKKKAAKTAGIALLAKKGLGAMTKLGLLAAVGAAVVKVLRRNSTATAQ